MSKFCQNCGAEVGETKFCAHCGAATGAAPTGTVPTGAAQPPVGNPNMKYKAPKKRRGPMVPILIVLAFVIILGIIGSNSAKNGGSTAKTNVSTPPDAGVAAVFDVNKIAGATLEELTAQFEELTDGGTIELTTHDGTVVQGQVYDYKDSGTNFVLVDGKVVSVQYYAETPLTYKKQTEILTMFGISADSGMKKEADTGSALRYSGVSDKVSDFWVQSMDTDKKVVEIVKVTFDSNYAGRLAGEPEKPDLEVLSYESVNDGYLQYVVGKVKNNSSKTYSYAQISINLYSGEAQVGSTLDNINNFEAGGVWEFKALVTADNCDSFKIVDVTGF